MGSESEGNEADEDDADDGKGEAADIEDGTGPQRLLNAIPPRSNSNRRDASDRQTIQDSDELMLDGPEPQDLDLAGPSDQSGPARTPTPSASEWAPRQEAGAREAFHDISTSPSNRTEGASEGAQAPNGNAQQHRCCAHFFTSLCWVPCRFRCALGSGAEDTHGCCVPACYIMQ